MVFLEDKNLDMRRYNAPTLCTEVGTIFVGDNGEPPANRNICVYCDVCPTPTTIKDWVCALPGAGHFQIHLDNRHLPIPFLLAVLQTPGPSFGGLLTAFHYRLSSTDCTLGNIPKQVAFVLPSVFP
ncbi:hypothetical protein AVEN_271315-1 [Araneus ventricosus]|uniref:Uncharacterized protein n=1 Tax=Araneus ventricosus TaxID=182803 RepID=A0A4Y2P584_ARAVE|nr:hypothetical protein AVEN_271315-1 [Araneus ventricosus]